ncbi:MAG TPA: DUF805 domain-containing protein [Stellaceae bacterium]
MKGDVIGFDLDANTGAISGHDGRRYDFATMDWHGDRRPQHGDVVDFTADGQRATQIYLVEEAYVAPSIGVFLLSPDGRISRSQYWLKWALPVFVIGIALALLVFVTIDDPTVAATIIPIFDLIILWPGIAILIKRSHDSGPLGVVHPLVSGPLAQLLAADRAFVPARHDRQQPFRARPGAAELTRRRGRIERDRSIGAARVARRFDR